VYEKYLCLLWVLYTKLVICGDMEYLIYHMILAKPIDRLGHAMPAEAGHACEAKGSVTW
jgi:hypothetical protein